MEANYWAAEGLAKFPHIKSLVDFVRSFGFLPSPTENDTIKMLHFVYPAKGLPLDIAPLTQGANVWTLHLRADGGRLTRTDYEPTQGRNSNLQQMLKHRNASNAQPVVAWKLSVVDEESLSDLGRVLRAYTGSRAESSKAPKIQHLSVKPVTSKAKLVSSYRTASEDEISKLRQKLEAVKNEDLRTEEVREVKQRRFQSQLRALLLSENESCEITGVKTKETLIASHIKPWKDSSDKEKIDLENVLLLCAHFDNLFDKGLISFDEDGKILISSKLSARERERLKLSGKEHLKNLPSARKRRYLQFHRKLHHFE